jgi:hypothetical protein
MAKNIKVTPEIEAMLKARVQDEDFDISKIVVYETILADTRPLNKEGSLFHGGQITRKTLMEMSEQLVGNNPVTVPLHTVHKYNNGELPSGRVFHAEVFEDDNDGAFELVGYLYIPNTRTEFIEDIDTGVLNSVSVGMLAKHLNCSECGWDYRGEDADFSHLWNRTCENGHTIGVDGVHLNLAGKDSWYETSLVSNGAVEAAKIVSRSKARLSQEEVDRLAADNMGLEVLILTATFTEREDPMAGNSEGPSLDSMTATLTSQAVELGQSKGEVLSLKAQIETLTASNTELQTKVDAVKTDETVKAELTAVTDKLKAAEAEVKAVDEMLGEHVKAALVASGAEVTDAPEGTKAKLAVIEDAKIKLHQAIPVGGISGSADGGAEQNAVKKDFSAFKTRT